ncbi:MAG: histidine phosphotransferase family protein [Ahrensia sp.]|nr:histidine phosphotransferase family protein [Ahrensia sp.]
MALVELSASDLGSLLCSRVCHDVISPVGAINNGLELLDEGGMDEDAMALIRQSAVNASARLQFARIAFGAAGSAGVQIDTGDAQVVAENYMKNEKPEFTWQGTRAYLPKAKVKLILNLLLIANGSVPRGGSVDFSMETEGENITLTFTAKGKMLRVPQKFQDMLDGRTSEDPIDAHSVQYYYTLLLAKEAGMEISVHMDDEKIIYSAA